jgi:hypothetical protein
MALRKFEGRTVIATAVAIKGAGDGLSKALAIEPEELTIGETVYVVMECTTTKISHAQVKDTEHLRRTQDLTAVTVAIADKELVADLLAAQQAKIDEAEGKKHLDFTEGGDGGE